MAATYRFKTIMVTDEARERFTNLRDSEDIKEFGRVTDKELFDAIWSLVDPKDVVTFMREKKRIAKQNKERQKLEALKKELESKLEQTDDTEEAADLDVAAQ
jgi:protein-arginine kinase activator protein McsA